MRSDRPKELRLSSWSLPRVALTGVDIYIKLQETYKGERNLKVQNVVLTIEYKEKSDLF